MAMKKGANTSIQIKVETKERLIKLGDKGDTYDTIIRRLIDEHEAPPVTKEKKR